MDKDNKNSVDGLPSPCWLVTKFVAYDAQMASEVREILTEARSSAATEPGHEYYVVAIDTDNPATTWVVEQWATQTDAERHEKAAEQLPSVSHLASLLAEPFSPTRLILNNDTDAATGWRGTT